MAQQFEHLFSPLKIGSITVRNRIVSAAHFTRYAQGPEFLPGDRVAAYWASKARGGTGLIVTEGYSVHPTGGYDPFHRPEAVERFSRAAAAAHRHGAKFVVQLFHPGAEAGPQPFPPSITPWAPSAVPCPRAWAVPHEMTQDEIDTIIKCFANAARVARQAGADGVELHAGHGYLLTEFMSPYFNRRHDVYGGSLENRLRFPGQVIDAVRQEVGRDFVVGLKVDESEHTEGGFTLDDMLVMLPKLTASGKIDYISVTAGVYISGWAIAEPNYLPPGTFVPSAAAIKKVVSIPVFARGRVNDPAQAEDIIARGQADMVTMTRAQIADPELARKAREGRVGEIRKCIACNEGCVGRVIGLLMPMTCSVNPAVGRELQPGWLDLEPAKTKKRIMVIGGGPAGLETARLAAARGHKVSLYEKGPQLGGAVLIAARAPGRDSFLDLVRYQERQMKLLGVDVHLNAEVTVNTVKREAPDAVVVATGSLPFMPDIPGIDQDHVVEARDVLTGVATGQRVVVVAGEHHIQALSVADLLAGQPPPVSGGQGKKVTVVCEEYHAGSQIDPFTQQVLYRRLYEKGVTFIPSTRVKRILKNAVVVADIFVGKEKRLAADSVVIACGGRENNSLYQALKGQAKEIYAVGDCAGVRRLMNATQDAARLGRAL